MKDALNKALWFVGVCATVWLLHQLFGINNIADFVMEALAAARDVAVATWKKLPT